MIKINKFNDYTQQKIRKEKGKFISFSEIQSYHTCPYSHKLQRIDKFKGVDNIYSLIGSKVHDIIEECYLDKVKKDELNLMFQEKVLELTLNGFEFPSDKVKDNYVSCVSHYFNNFEKDCNIKELELPVYIDLFCKEYRFQDLMFRGFIDAVLHKDNEVYIGDFKTSTIYKGADLIDKSKQLILYAIAYEETYKKKVSKIFFDFVKYKNVNGKTILRNESSDIGDKAYVYIELTDELKNDTIKWFKDSIVTITQDTEYKKNENDFFCNKLCGFLSVCKGTL